MDDVFDCMTVYACHDKTLPDGATINLYDEVDADDNCYLYNGYDIEPIIPMLGALGYELTITINI